MHDFVYYLKIVLLHPIKKKIMMNTYIEYTILHLHINQRLFAVYIFNVFFLNRIVFFTAENSMK